MGHRAYSQSFSDSSPSYTVALTVSVENGEALWNAAAERAMKAGMALSDILDTIGPREDPAIADCLAMLTAPGAIAGCALDNFAVREAIAPVAMAELIQLPVAERHLALLPAANG